MKHKALAIVLALCMVISMLPATVFAAPAQRTARIEAQPQFREELQALPELPAETTAGKYSISAKVVKGSSHGEIELETTSANAQETVYLMANPDDGYLVEFGGSYEYRYYQMEITYLGLDLYAITMPDGNVSLEIKFVAAEGSSHKINASVNNADWGTMTVSRTSAKAGESIIVAVAPKVTYILEDLSVSDANGDGVYGGYMGLIDGMEVYELIMPESALTITATFAKSAQHSITWGVSPAAAGSITLSHTKAYVGETVTGTFHVNPGYILDSKFCSANEVTWGDGNTFSFIMPDYDVQVTGRYTSYFSNVSVVVDTGLGGTAELDKTQGKPGDPVTLTCIPEEGYRVAQITGVDGIVDNGDGSYTFKMPGGVDVELHVLFLRNDNPFLDVNETHFFYESVLWAVEKGITNGIDDIHFGPFAVCNRAQVVTFLWRAAGSPEPTSTENPFTDVPADSWFTKPVLWAVEKGITNGMTADTFGPDKVCNRAQVVTFLFRAWNAEAPEGVENPFVDVPADIWYEAPVLWALANGITTGADSTHFNPEGECQRAQVVTFLFRADGIPKGPEPVDPSEPTDPTEPEPTDPVVPEPTDPVQTFELDLRDNGNGRVAYVDGKTSAAPGESIFFYAIPNEGYCLDHVGIFNPDGTIDVTTIQIHEHGDGLYELIMIPHDLIMTCYFYPIG